MTRRALLTVLLPVMLLSGCAQFTPYRTVPAGSATTGFECKVSGLPACEKAGADDSGVSPALQHRHYTASLKFKDKHGIERQDPQEQRDYFLSFVEFDDQGWFADRMQMEALFALLEDLESRNREVLIYVYAHGWKHNASACDNNVVCFSRLLERLDLAEKKIRTDDPDKQRTVVGVYLGWRGLPFGSFFNNLSFWSRKDTAARVGSGGVFELLTRLNDYRSLRQEGKTTDPLRTQLIITGHSFGGLAVYSALSHAFMERAARTTNPPESRSHHYDEVKSFGDFVMLVNPAFEGSLYEPLFHIATNRCYAATQRPVMMIVTSEADWATRVAFPMGRGLGTMLQHAKSPEQHDSILETIGHNSRYVTHDLIDRKDGSKATKVVDESECGCPYLKPTTAWDQQALLQFMGGVVVVGSDDNTNDYSGDDDPKTAIKLLSVPGKSGSSEYSSNYPFLVVKTDEKLIPNHNAIYNERFTNFTQVFMLSHVFVDSAVPLRGDRCKEKCFTGERDGSTRELSCLDDKGNACASSAGPAP